MQLNKSAALYEEYDDKQLIALFKNKDDMPALAALYERYMALVYGVCLKYLKNDVDGKDAVMQIFESLIDKLQKHEVENFKSWLHVVAKNFCLMQLRKNQGNRNIELTDNFMHLPESEHHISAEEKEDTFLLLEKCLETLNNEQQQTVRMFYLEEKCYKDVAEITGYELDKVRSYIQNGRRNLKICMEKNGE